MLFLPSICRWPLSEFISLRLPKPAVKGGVYVIPKEISVLDRDAGTGGLPLPTVGVPVSISRARIAVHPFIFSAFITPRIICHGP